jgi:hypothetical protein
MNPTITTRRSLNLPPLNHRRALPRPDIRPLVVLSGLAWLAILFATAQVSRCTTDSDTPATAPAATINQ